MRRFRLRIGRPARATVRFLFTIAALVDFALAGTRFIHEYDESLTLRLIAWGLFNISVIFLFLDRDNPPSEDDPPESALDHPQHEED